MKKLLWIFLGLATTALLVCSGLFLTFGGWTLITKGDSSELRLPDNPWLETIERTDYNPPPVKDDDSLVSDRLEDKHPQFNPDLFDRRLLGEWQVNLTGSVLALDLPMILPDSEGHLLKLEKSYADSKQAYDAQPWKQGDLLPSINMIDGKAKQFDDGLYAALDQAYFLGNPAKFTSHVAWIEQLLNEVGVDSPAAPFLAAGLETHGIERDVPAKEEKAKYLAAFERNPLAQKPISFYTWNEDLKKCWKFMKFFQRKLAPSDPIVIAIAEALNKNEKLRNDYQQNLNFYSKLTNPYDVLTIDRLADHLPLSQEKIEKLCAEQKVNTPLTAIFPPSTSRETELFNKLFPNGLPPEANLMNELIKRIRNHEVDLSPKENSGWYDHQVYALETLLLSENSEEKNNLMLSSAYKKRMLEAFKALITKRRETHARQLDLAPTAQAMPPKPPTEVKPRLRVEPNPTYFIRTARSYAFLGNFLESAVGDETLQELRGLTATAARKENLRDELRWMTQLYYGLYLISSEDIGHTPQWKEGEVVDQQACYDVATKWLETCWDDADLAQDTRVAIPIMVDEERGVTRLWVTLGVRLVKLNARYATPPMIRPNDGSGQWQTPEWDTLADATYLLPVDEFTEVELNRIDAFSREELRTLLPPGSTKEELLKLLK